MTFCFDLDETICSGGRFPDYKGAQPIRGMPERIRELREMGCRIIIWTARGTSYPMTDELRRTTLEQLQAWDVPFDELRFGKPVADVYVDDRGMSAADFMDDV